MSASSQSRVPSGTDPRVHSTESPESMRGECPVCSTVNEVGGDLAPRA
jgi:hypothetical protein